jgi:hypothetical protein
MDSSRMVFSQLLYGFLPAYESLSGYIISAYCSYHSLVTIWINFNPAIEVCQEGKILKIINYK